MKLAKREKAQCSAIVQPGEFVIDKWDNKQCIETHIGQLIKCEHCDEFFCLMMHWHKHSDSPEVIEWYEIKANSKQ